jgi:hypothetical protein
VFSGNRTYHLPETNKQKDNPVFSRLAIRERRCDLSNYDKLLALYEGLRVPDVCDGRNVFSLIDLCTMDREIRPLRSGADSLPMTTNWDVESSSRKPVWMRISLSYRWSSP